MLDSFTRYSKYSLFGESLADYESGLNRVGRSCAVYSSHRGGASWRHAAQLLIPSWAAICLQLQLTEEVNGLVISIKPSMLTASVEWSGLEARLKQGCLVEIVTREH